MKTIRVTIYSYDELSPEAKAKAREWWFGYGFATDLDHIIGPHGDAHTVALNITRWGTEGIKGCFSIDADKCATLIVENHGENCQTYKTAKTYLGAVKALGTIQDLVIPHTEEEENAHDEACYQWDKEKESLGETFLEDILADYHAMLRREIDFQESEEYIREVMQCNEYTFTKDGKRFG